ncbi:hypothetical protein [Streptomyces sp. NPDC003077]|uniref:hypothetical protein n=1 Tax=Streptomyces sp. NPDC003077 TaxID=3154443 RepID=UPI0033A31EB4
MSKSATRRAGITTALLATGAGIGLALMPGVATAAQPAAPAQAATTRQAATTEDVQYHACIALIDGAEYRQGIYPESPVLGISVKGDRGYWIQRAEYGGKHWTLVVVPRLGKAAWIESRFVACEDDE